jgi:hypothetical protein
MRSQCRLMVGYLLGGLALLALVVLPNKALASPGLAGGVPANTRTATGPNPQVQNLLGRLPLYFIENRGQLDPEVKFYHCGLQTILFSPQGISFCLPAEGASKGSAGHRSAAIRLTLPGMAPGVQLMALEP